MISFTGSTAVGCRIAEVAGRGMKRLLLELGGKGSAVVFDDADLATAVGTIGSVWTFHSGQICTAPTRVIAHTSVVDELVGKLAGMAKVLKVGDPLERDTVVGPVITGTHRERVEGYVRSAPRRGRHRGRRRRAPRPRHRLLRRPDPAGRRQAGHEGRAGGDLRAGRRGAHLRRRRGGRRPRRTTPQFGLYDYVFSKDTAKAMAVAKRLRSGNVGINTAQRNHEAAFGGFKFSGVGRDGGSWGLHAYSEMQSIVWPG